VISNVSEYMIKSHKENGMHGPLTLKMESDESTLLRVWVAEHAKDDVVWWCDRELCHVMAKTSGILIQMKLLFTNPI
jgi:hypothetical protein